MEAAQARLSLFVPKCHIVGNFLSWLKCLCCFCVDAVQKKLNFDLLTPSPGSVGGGGSQQHFFRHVRSSHTLLGKLS